MVWLVWDKSTTPARTRFYLLVLETSLIVAAKISTQGAPEVLRMLRSMRPGYSR